MLLIDRRLFLQDLRCQIWVLTLSIIIVIILENKILLDLLFSIVIIVVNIVIVNSSIFIGLFESDLFILIKLNLLNLICVE